MDERECMSQSEERGVKWCQLNTFRHYDKTQVMGGVPMLSEEEPKAVKLDFLWYCDGI